MLGMFDCWIESPSYTVGREEVDQFNIVQMNDLTIELIGREMLDLEEAGKLETERICPVRHGGLLDYPKVVVESAQQISRKWDLCLAKLSLVQNGSLVVPNGLEKGTRSENSIYPEDKNPEELQDFNATITDSAGKLLVHYGRMTEQLVKTGDMEKLAAIAGGLALIRNKLWFYNEVMDPAQSGKAFQSLYRECCDLIEALSEQMTLYHSTNIATVVLQDSVSQDWEDPKPFHEGERISYCIQMWSFYLQTTRDQMWSTLPPSIAETVLKDILNDSLSIMVSRYSSIKPSIARIRQYRGDIQCILLRVKELLFSLSLTFKMNKPGPEHSKLSLIHTKCELLVDCLTLVTAPISSLLQGTKVPWKLEDSQGRDKPWLELIQPQLFSKEGSRKSEIYLISRLISDRSQPSWPLLVQLCWADNRTFSSHILTQMGAFVPNSQEDASNTCGLSACSETCLGAAQSNWPTLVVQGVLWCLLYVEEESPTSLSQALEALLSRLKPTAWECMDRNNVWNLRRPVWVSAFIGLLLPFISGVIEEIVHNVENQVTCTLDHVPKAKGLLIKSLATMSETIPVPLLSALFFIKDFIPLESTALCGSVVVHLLLTTLYSSLHNLIIIFRCRNIEKDKIDFLLALNESICSINSTPELETMEKDMRSRLYLGGLDAFATKATENRKTLSDSQCACIAGELLQERSAMVPLTALYRFVCYNTRWIGRSLMQEGVGAKVEGAKMKPWNNSTHPEGNPAAAMKYIGFEEISGLVDRELVWVDWVTSSLASKSPRINKLFMLRPAFSAAERHYLNEEELEDHQKFKEYLQNTIHS